MIAALVGYLSSVRMRSDAEFNRMKATQGIMNGINQAANPNIGFSGIKNLHDRENNLMAQKTMAEFQMTATDAMQDSYRKNLKDNIRRSFSVFA